VAPRSLRESIFRIRLHGIERRWLEELAAKHDLSASSLVRLLVKSAHDAALVAERGRLGLTDNEIEVLQILTEHQGPKDRFEIWMEFAKRDKWVEANEKLPGWLRKLVRLGYLTRARGKYSLTARGHATGDFRAGFV
jgi:hypothetical protein